MRKLYAYPIFLFSKMHPRTRITFVYKDATALEGFLIEALGKIESLKKSHRKKHVWEEEFLHGYTSRFPMSGQMGRVSGYVSCETHNSIVTPSLRFLRGVPTDPGTKLLLRASSDSRAFSLCSSRFHEVVEAKREVILPVRTFACKAREFRSGTPRYPLAGPSGSSPVLPRLVTGYAESVSRV